MRVVAWNDVFEQLVGRAGDTIRGRHCWEVLRAVAADGTPVCREGCSVGLAAIGGRPCGTVRLMLGGASRGRRVSMSTLSAVCAEDRVVIHVFQDEGASDASEEGHLVSLSPRQREVLRLLGDGLGTAEIAVRLTISEETVRNHVRGVLAGLGCHTRLEAVARARQLRLI